MSTPLFPLRTVLFPGGWLPLQIFEVRYLDMVKRCWRDDSPFVVACLDSGSEVQRPGGEESFHPVGTQARIVMYEQPQPGLLIIGCRGEQRVAIREPQRLRHGLWVADCEPLADDAGVPVPDDLASCAQALREMYPRLKVEQAQALGPATVPDSGIERWDDSGWVANRWAELLPLAAQTRQRLMALDNPLLRLELVNDELDRLGVPR